MARVARALLLVLGTAASVGCNSASSGGNGASGIPSGGDGSSDAQAEEMGPAPDATLPMGTSSPLSGTQTCTVGYSGEPSQQTTTVLTISPSQVTQTSTSFTAVGLTLGPFAGAACTNQTVSAAVQVGSVAGASELGSNDADGGAVLTTCMPTGTDIGPLTVAVESGYFNPTVEQGKTALYLYVEITSAADGGAADGGDVFSYDDASIVQITCAFTLMPN
jgi:hypothetical protein